MRCFPCPLASPKKSKQIGEARGVSYAILVSSTKVKVERV